MSRSRSARGHALIVVTIVVLLMTVLVVGFLRFASREVAGAISAKQQAAVAACADAARQQLLSQLRLTGANSAMGLDPVEVKLDDTPTYVRSGHYGQDKTLPNIKGLQVARLEDLTTPTAVSADDLTNRIGETVGNYRVVAHCVQGTPPDTREIEVEFGLNFGL